MARITGFLNQYNNSGTRHSYSSGVNAFLSYIYNYTRKSEGQRISEEDKKQLELLADRYVFEGRDYEKDLIDFSNYCAQKYAPTSGRHYVAVVKEFLSYNDIELTRKQEKNVRNKTPEGGTITEEADLTKEMVRQLLNACDIRLKALILVLISSGVRIGEALNIHFDDIKFSDDGTYGILSLRGVSKTRGHKLKNRYSRVTFINKEAVEVLQQWYKVRRSFIEISCKKSLGRWEPSDIDDERIFPFGISAMGASFRTALKRANLFEQDKETGRASIHYHLFRKYFITTMTYSGIPDKFVNFYVGHLGELDRAYNKQSKDKLLEMYLKGEPHLRIFDESALEIAKTQEEIRETKDRVRDIQLENLDMKSKLQDFDKMQTKIQELEQRMSAINSLDKVSSNLKPKDHEAIAKIIIEIQKEEGN